MLSPLERYEIEEAQEVKESFKVTDLESSNWCLRKLAALQKEQNEIDRLAQSELERIETWKAKEIEKINSSKEFFESLLGQYFVEQREVDKKFKISTPYGTVSTRKQQPKWEYNDKQVIESLKKSDMDNFIKTKEELDKAALKKAVKVVEGKAITEDGEVIEGITVIELGEKVVVKVNE